MAMKEDVIVQCENVSWEVEQRLILDNINFQIKKGQFISIIGPNGAGKSSLCKVILGLIKPSDGKVLKRKNLHISYVPQIFSVSHLVPIGIEAFMKLNIKKK